MTNSEARKRANPTPPPAVLARVQAYVDACDDRATFRLRTDDLIDWCVDATHAEHRLTLDDVRELLALAEVAR